MSAQQEPPRLPCSCGVILLFPPHTQHAETHPVCFCPAHFILLSLLTFAFTAWQLFDKFLRIHFIAINIICLPLK